MRSTIGSQGSANMGLSSRIFIGSLRAALNASTASASTRSRRMSGLVNMGRYRSDMPIRMRVWARVTMAGRSCGSTVPNAMAKRVVPIAVLAAAPVRSEPRFEVSEGSDGHAVRRKQLGIRG